jgi:hypothetical protein
MIQQFCVKQLLRFSLFCGCSNCSVCQKIIRAYNQHFAMKLEINTSIIYRMLHQTYGE